MQKLKKAATLLLAVLLIVTSLPLSALAATVDVESDVVLYSAYGGGGNSRSYYKNDYIVLKNIGSAPVSLDGLKVEAYSKGGTSPLTNGTISLEGSLDPGAYYLIRGQQGSGGVSPLPSADKDQNVGLSGTGFKIYLKDASGKLLDMVGASKDASDYLGSAPAPAPSNPKAIIRKDRNGDGVFDRSDITGDNAADWEAVEAKEGHLDYLKRTAEGGEIEEPTPSEPSAKEVTSIADARKAAEGTEVSVEGVVVFSSSDGNTFIQDDTAGINVFRVESALDLGTKVRVTGKRDVYSNQLQISSPTVENLGEGTLPEPQIISLDQLGNEEYNGERVKVLGVTLGAIDEGRSTPITKDGVKADIYKIPQGEYKETDVVDIVGVAGVYYNNPQIRVHSASDITVATAGAGPAPIDPLPEASRDPLSEETIAEVKKNYPDVLTIPEVQKIYKDNAATIPLNKPYTLREDVSVIGVATYAYSGGSSLIIEDVIDGEIYGYQIYGPTENVEPGDIVVARGNLVTFYGLPELSNVSAMKRVGGGDPVEVQVLTTAQIREYADQLVNEYVYIEEVTLPELGKNADFTDSTGTLATYQMPEYPMATKAGDVVDIRGVIAPHMNNPQIRLNDSSDYRIKNDTVKPHIVVGDFVDARAGIDYDLTVEVMDNAAAIEVVMTYGEESLNLTRDPITGKWKGTIPGSYLSGKESLALGFTAKDEAGNVSEGLYKAPFRYGESTSIGDSVTLNIDNRPQLMDPKPASLTATGDEKRPEISVGVKNVSENATATVVLNGKEYAMTRVDDRFAYTPDADLKDGSVDAEVTVKDGEKSNALAWKFYVGESLSRHFRGQLHSHSNYSDGSGTPLEAVDYASKAEAIDFFALTDHSNYFDEAGNLGTLDDENSGLRAPDGSGVSKWKRYKEIVESKRTENFLPLYGYEMTWTKSGANYGHINTYNTEGFVSRNNSELNDKSESQGLLRYYDLLKGLGEDTFSEFNHPGYTFGTFDDFAHYNPQTDDNIKLVEIGNGEGPIHGNGYFPSYDQYWKALDMGWKLAPSINQDNHKRKWGDGNDGRNVVIAENLTKEDIIGAIRSLHVYASEDKNITVDYSIDGHMMGSTISPVDNTLDIEIIVSEQGGESIGKVDVMTTGGKVLHSMESAADTDRFTFELENNAPYYFVRITQNDGDHVFTAPIWTGKVDVKGITAFTPEGGNEGIVGEAKSFKYAFEADGETVESIQVLDGKDVIGSADQANGAVTVTPIREGAQNVTLVIKTDKDIYKKEEKLIVYPKNLETTPIQDVRKAEEGEVFQIEGTLTSNASGYDENTAFFDSAYIQDQSGGINIFPIDGDYKIGDKLKIRGIRSAYQGEGQLNVTRIEKTGTETPFEPTSLKTGEVGEQLGLLVRVKGTVLSIDEENGVINALTVDDGSGPIRVFIDGYIGRLNDSDKSMPEIEVKDTVEAIGLSSIDPEGNRIRVRNRDEVKVVEDERPEEPKPGESNPDTPKPEEPNRPGEKPQENGGIVLTPIGGGSKPQTKPEPEKNPEPVSPKRFSDVDKEAWYADAVGRIVAKGIMKGISDDEFGPNLSASRAMIVTMLHRMAKEPKVSTSTTFDDIEAESWYADAVAWADAEGITQGVSENTFDPDGQISREAFITMIYRSLEKRGVVERAEETSLEGVSDWAQTPMAWAKANQIVVGREGGDLAAGESVTRAEIATIILRVMDRYKL